MLPRMCPRAASAAEFSSICSCSAVVVVAALAVCDPVAIVPLPLAVGMKGTSPIVSNTCVCNRCVAKRAANALSAASCASMSFYTTQTQQNEHRTNHSPQTCSFADSVGMISLPAAVMIVNRGVARRFSAPKSVRFCNATPHQTKTNPRSAQNAVINDKTQSHT